jgi:hypothetical protein
MNKVSESEVIFFLNEEKEEFSFYNEIIQEHIKDLELILKPYFEYLQDERLDKNCEDDKD